MNLGVPYFDSLCQPLKGSRILFNRFARFESRAKTPLQVLLIDRFAKITGNPLLHGSSPVNVIGVTSHEDCRNRANSTHHALQEWACCDLAQSAT